LISCLLFTSCGESEKSPFEAIEDTFDTRENEELKDALEDLEKEAKDLGKEIESGLKELGNEMEKTAKNAEKDLKDAYEKSKEKE
ncbi:MAG: hypothetical protein AAFY98_10945, partial [Verrucomicrobiota bacterium]